MARYIDVDKLIHHLEDEIKACEPKFGGRANGKSIAYGTILGLKSAISFAETLSTADVAPKSEVVKEIGNIIEQRINSNKERSSGIYIKEYQAIMHGRDEAYRDLKEIIEQKYTEGET